MVCKLRSDISINNSDTEHSVINVWKEGQIKYEGIWKRQQVLLGIISRSGSIGKIWGSGSKGRRHCSRENRRSGVPSNKAWSAFEKLLLEVVGVSYTKCTTEE